MTKADQIKAAVAKYKAIRDSLLVAFLGIALDAFLLARVDPAGAEKELADGYTTLAEAEGKAETELFLTIVDILLS